MAVKGLSAHRKRLALMASGMSRASARELLKAAQVVEEDARQSMNAGAVSGVGHVPSLPGQPAKSDTHVSERSIHVRVNQSGRSVSVVGGGAFMYFEWGTSKMIERPVLRPALRRNRNRIILGQVQAVNGLIRAYKGG